MAGHLDSGNIPNSKAYSAPRSDLLVWRGELSRLVASLCFLRRPAVLALLARRSPQLHIAQGRWSLTPRDRRSSLQEMQWEAILCRCPYPD